MSERASTLSEHSVDTPQPRARGVLETPQGRELKNICHHHPDSKKGKSSEENSGSLHPYGRYGNAVKTGKTISTIAILWPVKAIFEKRAATVEVDTFISPEAKYTPPRSSASFPDVSVRFSSNPFSGKSKGGLAKGGLAQKAPIGPKRALSGQLLLFPRGCGVRRNWSRSAPKRPR